MDEEEYGRWIAPAQRLVQVLCVGGAALAGLAFHALAAGMLVVLTARLVGPAGGMWVHVAVLSVATGLAGAVTWAWGGLAARTLSRREAAGRGRLACLQGLLDEAPQGILIHRDFRPLYVNSACARLWGYGTPRAVMALPSIRALLPAALQGRAGGGEGSPAPDGDGDPAAPVRICHRHRDGSSVWIEARQRPVDWNGAQAVQVTLSDVTAAVRAEQAGQMLRDALDCLPDALILCDANDRLVFFNRSYAKFFPALPPRETLVGVTFEALARLLLDHGMVDDPQAERDPEAWVRQRLAAHRDPDAPPTELRLHDGRIILMQERRTSSGGIVGIRTDITSLKRAELLLRDTIENIHEFIAVYDDQDRFVMCNRRFHETYPYMPPAEALVGRSFADILRITLAQKTVVTDPLAQSDPEAWLRRRLEQRRRADGIPFEWQHGDGRWFLVREQRTQNGYTVVLRVDITEQKARELELQQVRDRLEHQTAALRRLADDLEQARQAEEAARHRAEEASRSKSRFLANMSHELRTPLNAILGFSEVIQQQLFGPVGHPRYREYACDIHDAGQHLLALINDILDLSKVEAGRFGLQPEFCALRPVVDDTLNLLADRIRAGGLEVSVDLAPGCTALVADVRALKQILLNLLSNAVKFTPPGGRFAIRTRGRADGGIDLVVTDSGIGIPAQDLERVVLPFEQVDTVQATPGQGTGLGLALVKSMIELHGGRLVLDSRIGAGTTATLEFPPACVPAESNTAQSGA